MKVATNITLLCLLIVYSLTVFGCGKKEEQGPGTETGVKLDESTPISQVKAEAEKMDADQLRAIAIEYRDAIEAKSAETEKIAKEIMKAMTAGNVGDRAKTLNAQMSEMNKSMEALTARFQVYLEKLKEKGGDVSGLEM